MTSVSYANLNKNAIVTKEDELIPDPNERYAPHSREPRREAGEIQNVLKRKLYNRGVAFKPRAKNDDPPSVF